MPQVVIKVNNRSYTMECGEGQEEHLRRLARRVDAELTRIREMAGPVGEIRLLLMTALLIADRVSELEGKLAALEQEVEQLRKAGGSAQAEPLLQALRQATEKLQLMARSAQAPST